MYTKINNKLTLLAVLVGFVIVMLWPIRGYADSEKSIVKVGYYENENFQEGASENAVKSGYSYEYLQKIAAMSGWKYEYVYGSWAEIYDAFLKGEIDVLAGLGYSESRLDVMYYPDYPMGFESHYLYIRVDDDSITVEPKTLNGKKIGTISGLMEQNLRAWLEEHDVTAQVIVFDDVPERDEALEKYEIDAFIGEGASVSGRGINRPLLKITNVDMYLCVAKGRKDILNELNATLAILETDEPYYIYELSEKYFGLNAVSTQVNSTELEWLKEHDYTIKIGYMDDFLPYCGTDENGNATGIMVDTINASFANLRLEGNIKFEYYAFNNTDDMIEALHNHEIEMLFPISDNIYYLEQNELYHSKEVITSAMNFVYKDDVDEADNLPLAINRNNQIQYDYANTHFEGRDIIFYDSVDECLKAVADGTAGGAILSGLRVSNLLKAKEYENLDYVELPYATVKCFGISTMHNGIVSLVNRALNTLDEGATMRYTYKYIGHSEDYSIREFVRRHALGVALGFLALVTGVLVIVGLVIVKHQREKLYFNFAYKDSLTQLYNRRSYEEELEKYKEYVPENLMCISMDLNGLKNINDNLGHNAGDELIREAGRLVTETFGTVGRIYRTGGDEYFGIVKTTMEKYEQLAAELKQKCLDWKGEFSEKMFISVGYAVKEDADDIIEMCKCADKRMYEAKAAYYRDNNINRRRS